MEAESSLVLARRSAPYIVEMTPQSDRTNNKPKLFPIIPGLIKN